MGGDGLRFSVLDKLRPYGGDGGDGFSFSPPLKIKNLFPSLPLKIKKSLFLSLSRYKNSVFLSISVPSVPFKTVLKTLHLCTPLNLSISVPSVRLPSQEEKEAQGNALG